MQKINLMPFKMCNTRTKNQISNLKSSEYGMF